MTENIRLVDGIANDRIKEARKRMKEARAAGDAISMEDMLASRGLVLGEREHSIFSDAWIPLAVGFVVVGFFLGRNVPCMTLGAILLLMAGVGTWWKNRALDWVAYHRAFDRTHVFPGEPIQMSIDVVNRKRLPLTWLQFSDKIRGPVRITADKGLPMDSFDEFTLVSTFAIKSYEHLDREVILQFPERGFYQIGPPVYQAGDLFTLFTIEREYAYRHTLVVYPQVWPLEELGLPAKEPFGELKVRRSLFTDPIKTRGIRDYQPQDRFRDIHWKATARRGDLQTKIYDPSTGMTAVVFLNISTAEKYWMGAEEELLERLIGVAASILNYGSEQNWGIGVYANGTVPRSDQAIKVQPGRSPNQLMHVLEALAAVTGFATGSIENLLRRETTNVPWASTIIVVTAMVSDSIVVTLNHLRDAGRRIVLISLAEDPPPKSLSNILAYHIPSTVPAFQTRPMARTLTEASLQNVPTPEPVEMEPVA